MSSIDDLNKFVKDYVEPFSTPCYIFDDEYGFIVWRWGTGNNIELLHIRAKEVRKGYGTILFHKMLKEISSDKDNLPYHSIYGFTRVSNERAVEFYIAMGFHTQKVGGLYQEGNAILFCQDFDKLIAKMLEKKK